MKTYADYGIDVRGSHGEVDTTCPDCSSERKKKNVPCLSVNLDKGTWICHHCGWSGGLGKDTKRHDAPWNKPAYRKPDVVIKSGLPDKPTAWFEKRGISANVLKRNKVGYGEVYIPQIQGKANAIKFPYYDGDELINVKYRDGNKNFRMEAGAERVLYGLNDITDVTVIVEGEIDKLSVEMAGIVSCVSVPDGAPTENTKNYSSKFSFLDSAEKKLSGVKTFILAVDSDAPGKRLEDELSRRLGRERCKRVSWPDDVKDANECLVKYGVEVLRGIIEAAQEYPIAGVFTIKDVSDRIDNLYENGLEKGVSTGWPCVDEFYTVRPGEFTIVTGIPNSGKSNWIDSLTVNLAKSQGWRFALFSPENQPLEDHMSRIIEKWSGLPFTSGVTKRMSREELERGKEWADEHFSWILPDDDADWTIDLVLDAAKSLVFREGIRGLVIDPWNELEHPGGSKESETAYISRSLKRIRQFGRKHGVHIWIVVHPAKLYKDNDGNYPVPTLYDCAGSAHWRNKADNGLSIWRDMTDGSRAVDIHVQKIRFRQIGKLGMASVKYCPSNGSYIDDSGSFQRKYGG